jgi:hypothetical protein
VRPGVTREFNHDQLAITDAVEARMAVRRAHKLGVDFVEVHHQTNNETGLCPGPRRRAVRAWDRYTAVTTRTEFSSDSV